MRYCLQNRWRLEGHILYYYGLRNRENLHRNKRRITHSQEKIINQLPKELSDTEIDILNDLVGDVVVTQEQVRKTPTSLEEARFCISCCANDFMIPGLEFDDHGQCPICQTREENQPLRSVVPLVTDIPRSKSSRFDIALFFTGGKDSTFLLYHLAKVLKLRVLALTWEIPYMSANARASIENAKKRFSTVEFVNRYVNQDDLRKIYRKLYELSENTCACPSLAYILFYPTLVEERVPYFIVGNEPAQMIGLYYNGLAPKYAYTFSSSKWFNPLVNIGRVLTLHPLLRKGQLHTLMTMRQLAYGDPWIKRVAGYSNDLITNVVTAIHEVPSLLEPLKRAIRKSSWTGHVPAFVQIDFDQISQGHYDWRSVKELLVRECGWVPADETGKGLHTSCQIEKCKEYSQFMRFYHCRSKLIPFSALEMAIASANMNLSREDAIREIRENLGFSLEELPECAIMKRFIFPE